MRIGKLDNDTLNALILSKFAHTRSEVLCSPQVGVDCAAVDMGGRIAVLSTDPITAADKHLGALTVHVSCNDAAAAGAEADRSAYNAARPAKRNGGRYCARSGRTERGGKGGKR